MARLLCDSNSYFRLARYVTPFLGQPYGDPPFTIYVIKELDVEFSKSPRLVNKFYWVNETPHIENRADNTICGEVDPYNLRETIKFMKSHKYERGLGVSKVDIAVLATAYDLGITIISDDIDVQEMAADYDMTECMSSLEVVEWLHSEQVLSMALVKAIVQTWKYEKDLPMKELAFVNTFFEWFGEVPWE
ncbi:MAG: hypothetical protein V4632_19920 [Pseudomonadota bacterium]